MLFHTLTVYETLLFAARLRLPREMSLAEKKIRVDEVLTELGLNKCSNTRIGNARLRGVSGGERKRVSIALEILRGPAVLFLDECTSGLDSFQALRVVTTIKELAKRGRTVVTSIHQPRSSIFLLFDDLIVLSEGSLMYFGKAGDVVSYFDRLGYPIPKNFNPADFILDTVSLDLRSEGLEAETSARIQRLAEAAASQLHVTSDDDQNVEIATRPVSKRKYEAPLYLQFLLLGQRAARQKIRDVPQLLIPLVMAVLFGLILGFIYFQNGKNLNQNAIRDKSGMFFFIALNQSFNGMFSVIGTFPNEKSIVNRERAAKSYALLPYFFSKVLADIPNLVYPFIFITIAYWLAGFAADAVIYLQSVFICLATYMVAAGMGLIASAVASSTETAQNLIMPFMLIFVLFSGFYANSNLIPDWLAWIQWVSPIRWSYAGFMAVVVAPMVFICDAPGCIPNGQGYLESRGLGSDTFSRSAIILVCMAFGFQIIGYLILRFKRTQWVVPKV